MASIEETLKSIKAAVDAAEERENDGKVTSSDEKEEVAAAAAKGRTNSDDQGNSKGKAATNDGTKKRGTDTAHPSEKDKKQKTEVKPVDPAKQTATVSGEEHRGLEALSVVLRHEESDELDRLRAEVKELRILKALQTETAVHQNIYYWFDKVNDPQDSVTSIETLKEMRDYILAHSVDIMTMQAIDTCRFSLIGGHYELMSSILAACQRYDQAVATKGMDAVTPQDWQWDPSRVAAQICHAQCLRLDHLHVEPRSVAVTRYPLVMDFPTSLVEVVARGEDPRETALRRLHLVGPF